MIETFGRLLRNTIVLGSSIEPYRRRLTFLSARKRPRGVVERDRPAPRLSGVRA